MAIDAGLGELGRLGLLITPKYGPRVRLAKVITDMPLVPDSPISFGVREFCEACMLCAEHCPSSAITDGTRTWKGKSLSNNPGTLKWYIESEKCYDFNGFSCPNCKRVCPFTKPNNSWLHQMIRQIIKTRVSQLNKLMVELDQASGFGQQLQDTKFWQMLSVGYAGRLPLTTWATPSLPNPPQKSSSGSRRRSWRGFLCSVLWDASAGSREHWLWGLSL